MQKYSISQLFTYTFTTFYQLISDADDERIFSFVRVQTGDELSRRSKFALVIWCGSGVSVLKRARVSTDKILVKDILQVRTRTFINFPLSQSTSPIYSCMLSIRAYYVLV